MQDNCICGTSLRHELKSVYNVRSNPREIIEIPAKTADYDKVIENYGKENVKFIKSRDVYKCTSNKEPWKLFEDRVWRILYDMGFEELNYGNDCKFLSPTSNNSKQIDIFARFNNIICIIECKTTQKITREVKTHIREFSDLKSEADPLLRKKYGCNGKVHIVWIMATDFSQYEKGTIELAKEKKIRLINNWAYYEKLVNVLGAAARYQFLANLFSNREISDLSPKVLSVKGKIGGYTYYQFSIAPIDLMRISFVPHANADHSLESYQRLVKPNRLKKIQKFIEEYGGLFPTNIVINLSTNKDIRFDSVKSDEHTSIGVLYLPNSFGSAEIIDGQHRLFSYAGLEEAKTELIPVIAFDNIDFDTQTTLFTKINGEQEKVSKNLLNQIMCTQTWNTGIEAKQISALPLKIIMELNTDPKSPLCGKIKMEGDTVSGNVTATYAELSDKMRSLNLFYIKSKSRKKNVPVRYNFIYYLSPSETLEQTKNLLISYFQYILDHSATFYNDWCLLEKSTFSKNSTLVPLLGVFEKIIHHINKKTPLTDVPMSEYIDEFNSYVKPIADFFDSMSDESLEKFTAGAGKKGYSQREDMIIEAINGVHDSFMPEYVKKIKEQKVKTVKCTEESNKNTPYLQKLELEMQFIIKSAFANKHGDKWFSSVVPEESRKNAINNSVSRGEYLDFIRGCCLIDLKKIIDYKNNYDVVGKIFDIYNDPNKKKADRTSWIVDFNKRRNNIAHPSWSNPADFEKIKEYYDLFNINFEKYLEDNELEEEWSSYLEYVPPVLESDNN